MTTRTAAPQSPAVERGSALLDPAIVGGPMRLADLVEGYWAITPAMHDEIRAIYDAHMRGDKIDIKGVEARIGRPLANERKPYQVLDGGVALIDMSGVIAPKANMFTQISGGATASQIRADILQARADPAVRSAILYADTPGGNVLGIAEGAAAWRDFAATKPAATFSDGTLASAGYWWGSAGSKVYISGPMVNVGSIGVRTEIVDTTAADAAAGIKRRTITAGRYKAAGSDLQDAEAIAYKQAQVDYLYTLFVDTVAQHRGVSAEQVLADMADGRVFIGQQAISAGLVDGIMSLEELAARMATDPQSVAPLRRPARSAPARRTAAAPSASMAMGPDLLAGAASSPVSMSAAADLPDEPVLPVTTSTTSKEITMNREELERDHPALVAAIRSEAAAEAKTQGATAERERIQAVLAQSMPGHEALVQRLAFDGRTTGPDAAVQVLAAHRATLANAAAGHFADAPKAAPAAAQVGDEPGQAKPAKAVPNVSRAYALMNGGSKAA